jgi:hypothetical protein
MSRILLLIVNFYRTFRYGCDLFPQRSQQAKHEWLLLHSNVYIQAAYSA